MIYVIVVFAQPFASAAGHNDFISS